MTDLVSALFLLGGAVFTLIAGMGLHRFDDVFARMHAAGKSSTFGLALVLCGAAIRLGDAGATARLVLVWCLAVITIPAGVHVIARAAWRAGSELSERTLVDDD
ncbi:MAG: monovalent cation/H(+) antiporter subunit G [Acidimicrobiales bacterium]|nr:monovalent cation/H(+) antiporter subunit G [Acidimicrobiales bacterium]